MRKKLAEKLLSKLPSHIRVTSKSSYELLEIEDFKEGDRDGECRPTPQQIIVRKGLSPSNKFSTYVHETIHALNFEYEIGLSEAQVLKLEAAIMKLGILNKIFDLLGKNC